MTPDDFRRFREVEFAEDSIPPEQLNPAGNWVVYVAAKDGEGTTVISTTVAVQESKSRTPSQREAYVAALMAVPDVGSWLNREGYELPPDPPLRARPLPPEYRATA